MPNLNRALKLQIDLQFRWLFLHYWSHILLNTVERSDNGNSCKIKKHQ